MSGRRWFLTGVLAAIAAAGAYAALAAGPVPIVQEPVERIRQEWDPETVCFAIAEQAHIGPDEWAERVGSIGAPARVPVPHEWTEDDVELLARLLWSSPLRHEDMKRQLVWVVLNRVDDERQIFPATIRENVTRKEFTFYDRKAYLSETNVRIAREELERWTRVLSGIEERPVPEGYVYLRFAGDNNRMIYLSKEIGGDAL